MRVEDSDVQSSETRQVGSSRKQRSKDGCATCRIRRIKCDERQPRCLRCESRGHECMWSEEPATSLPSAASLGLVTRGPKTSTACIECRKRKTRCSGPTTDHLPCERCARWSLPCEWTKRTSPSRRRETGAINSTPASDPAPSSVSTSFAPKPHGRTVSKTSIQVIHAEDPDLLATALTSKVELVAFVRTYFGTVHQHGYLGFLHEPTIMRLIDQDRAPRQLLWLIVANAMRYAENESSSVAWSRGDELAFSAFRSLESQVHDNVGAIHLMAVILAHHHEYGRGRFSSSWILAGNAVRIMQLLRLHILPTVWSPQSTSSHGLLTPEALRRLAWAVFYMDTMNDCGTYGMHTLTEDMIRIQLPCDEATFLRGEEVKTESLHPTRSPSADIQLSIPQTDNHLGVSAYTMRAAALRRRILHFGSRINYVSDDETTLEQELELLNKDLQEVLWDLPAQLAYTRTNFFVLKVQNSAFVLLHMLRQNCMLMLLQAKMAMCERYPRRRAHLPSLWKGRIETSLVISDIVCDALKDGVHCDTYIGVQAYGALEILIFDPLRLAKQGQPIVSSKALYIAPLKALMQLIRHQSQHHATLFNLRLEASHRLIRSGLAEVLNEDDWSAYRCGYTPRDLGGEEYDFRAMDWYQDESRIEQGAEMEPDEVTRGDTADACGTTSAPIRPQEPLSSPEPGIPDPIPQISSPSPRPAILSSVDRAHDPFAQFFEDSTFNRDSMFAVFGDAAFPLWSRDAGT